MTGSLEDSLAAMRLEISPSGADKARLRALILAPACASQQAVGDAATPPLPPSPAPLTPWAALKAAGTFGLATGTLLLGTGVGIGVLLERNMGRELAPPTAALSEPAQVPSPERPEPPAPESVIAEPAPLASRAAPSEPRERRASPPRRATRQALAPNPLNDELAVLRRVERALRNSDPALALALLTELDQRFPESRLVEERQAARHIANCRLENPDAVAQARAFLREHPASVYRQRVQLACEGAAPAGSKHPDAALKNAGTPGH
jgi:hypothetical protein